MRTSTEGITDYYPFGVVVTGRQYISPNSYRFGFNGKEHEDNIAGGDYDFGARIYDSRIARWLATDPRKSPSVNPYCFAENSPLYYNDPDGKFAIPVIYFAYEALVILSAAIVATVVTVEVNEVMYTMQEDLDRSKLTTGIIQPIPYKSKPHGTNDPNFKFNNGGKYGVAGAIVVVAGLALRAYNLKLSDGTKVGDKLYSPAIEEIAKAFEDNHLDIISTMKNTIKQGNIIKTNEVFQVSHIIQPDEVLSSIAQKYNTTVDIILEMNPGIKDADVVKAGQTIVIDKLYIETTTTVNASTKTANINVKVENQKQRKERVNNIKQVIAKYKK